MRDIETLTTNYEERILLLLRQIDDTQQRRSTPDFDESQADLSEWSHPTYIFCHATHLVQTKPQVPAQSSG